MGVEVLGLVILGFAAGTLGSLLGLGGGFLVVPALLIWKAFDPRIASGTAVVVIIPAMLITLWQRGMQGHVDWKTGGIIAAGAVAGAFLGSWLAGRLDPVWIRRIFALVLLLIAARLLLWNR